MPYQNFTRFVLRTPSYPLSFVSKLTSKDQITDEEVKGLCGIQEISEAIYIASPPLFYEMQKWINGEIENGKKADKKIAKLKGGIIRYLLRMSTRCTPFGLFAGFTTGKFSDLTKIDLLDKNHYISHTRLDMNYLCALAMDISKHEDVKDKLSFFPNSSIYSIGEQLRYVEFRYINSKRQHNIVAVDNSEYVQKVLEKADNEALINDLSEFLVEEDDISFDEANDFIEELIESQLLLSELEPTVTGDEFLDQIIDVLAALNLTKKTNKILNSARKKTMIFLR